MKYKILVQIGNFLKNFKKIANIKRVDDRIILIEFDNKTKIFFDMDKTNSSIYISDDFLESKIYKAPFDVVMSKRLNSSFIEICEILESNRILHLRCIKKGSYKNFITNLYFEFTGRFTNIILTDENDTILEALSHYENSARLIKVGKILTHLQPISIKEKPSKDIDDVVNYLKNEFQKINLERLNLVKNSKILALDKKIENIYQNINSLEKESDLLKKSEISNQKGMILTANLHSLNDWDRDFTLFDFDGNSIKFNLNFNPKFEAKMAFEESKKLKQKANGIKFEKEILEDKMNFYVNLKELIKSSNSINEINILLPKKNKKNNGDKTVNGVENFYIRDFKISVGKNEKANIFLLKNSKKDDFWFHLKDRPSSHVIVKTNKQNLDIDTIFLAAKICVNFSVKQSGKYLVDFTKRGNVKVKDGAFVNYTNFDTIDILKP
ncbi:DUF814 domain-containing protein [Campylobacter sp. FMV-PI01]|uniref:DUF814 domain-containing protein n=1 Tax=Campylobacter portucalensis TaxID=2608384 RepID=A0A6L5WGK1_9BACT|nr:NFACT family protein [Campylobacter portucalensis]MSN95926.1 DUF814 domain-containing protein [Campylobacter portucalensis]